MTANDPRYDDLRAIVINCTRKRAPQRDYAQGLIDVSRQLMGKHGVAVELVR